MLDSVPNVYFISPNPNLVSWEKGCGKMVCTGKWNNIITDWDGSFFGNVSQAIPANPGII